MRLKEILVEESLEEMPAAVGKIGAGIGKMAGKAAQGVGKVAGAVAGLGSAFKQGWQQGMNPSAGATNQKPSSGTGAPGGQTLPSGPAAASGQATDQDAEKQKQEQKKQIQDAIKQKQTELVDANLSIQKEIQELQKQLSQIK